MRTALITWAVAVSQLAAAPLCAQAPEAGRIRGVVLDTRGGTPLRRVSVRLQKTDRTTLTGDDGRFEIDQVPAGEHELSCRPSISS